MSSTATRRPLVRARTVGAVVALVAAGLVVAATSPASDRSVDETPIGPIELDPADEQVEGSILVGAVDPAWDRVVQTMVVELDPAPPLARVDLLDDAGDVLTSSVVEDGSATVSVESDCPNPCEVASAYRVVAGGDEPLTFTADLSTAFDSDLDSGLEDVSVELPEPEVVAADASVGFAGDRPEVDVTVSPSEPVGGALVTLGGTWCELDTIEIVALSTPPSGPDPVDPQVAQIVGNQSSMSIAHEQVVEVPVSCQGDSDVARSFWLTVAGAGEVERTVRFVLSGDAPTEQVGLVVGEVDQPDEVQGDVSSEDAEEQITLEPGPTSELATSRLLFVDAKVSNPYTVELTGPLTEVFTTSSLDLGVTRLAVGPCPPEDCEAPITGSLSWLYPGSDEPPVQARFTLWSVEARE